MASDPRISSPRSHTMPTLNLGVSSKLPKFLQKQTRDRSKSTTNPTDPSPDGSFAEKSSTSGQVRSTRKSTKLLAFGRDQSSGGSGSPVEGVRPYNGPSASTLVSSDNGMDEPPVIIEPASPSPIAIPRSRTRSERPTSERPLSEASPSSASYSNGASNKLSDIPNRLSGWFQHAFSASSTDLTLPTLLSQPHLAASTTKVRTNALLTAAKHGKGHLDKAFRYILDTDATPDKCMAPIWLLGVQHPGYEPPPPPTPTTSSISRRGSVDSRRAPSFHSSSSSSSSHAELSASPQYHSHPPVSLSSSLSSSISKKNDPAHNWPPAFYADISSRIWLTYRSQFTPIRDLTLAALESGAPDSDSIRDITPSFQSKRWPWHSGEKCWTSDAGWGCMLRTGQSLLANALMHLHLGREWSRPPHPVCTAEYATYVKILTWFFDTPSPAAPFSVHRMALAGKELGTDVGQWFGPSVAAGALKTLVEAFPEAGVGVSVASDGVVFQSDVFASSQPEGTFHVHGKQHGSSWGGRAVLVLIGIRLGIEGVNPIYYDTIKALYTFPQSVGIAGGRPSSSYYFVGSQADNLFYLDPHHTRPAIPLRPPREPEETSERSRASTNNVRSPTSPSSVRTGSSTFSYHAPLSPSPLQHQLSNVSSGNASVETALSSSQAGDACPNMKHAPVVVSLPTEVDGDGRGHGHGHGHGQGHLDVLQMHYVNAYSATEMKTFHCDRVRKMPLSGLDPSMLLGFLCRDEQDWMDFRARVANLSANHKTIFTIQDEPPNWPLGSDDDLGLESWSEPEPDEMDFEGEQWQEEQEEEQEEFYDVPSPDESYREAEAEADVDIEGEASKSSFDLDTEEDSDPVGPMTPGGAAYDVGIQEAKLHSHSHPHREEDEWVGSGTGTDKSKNGRKKRRKPKKINVPSAPVESFPFPRSTDEQSPSPPHSPGLSNRPEKEREKEKPKRMHTARARDGGRTQSGGVRGVLD